jgi:hypothetical protein
VKQPKQPRIGVASGDPTLGPAVGVRRASFQSG